MRAGEEAARPGRGVLVPLAPGGPARRGPAKDRVRLTNQLQNSIIVNKVSER